jgi:Ran GTPase-activating protein (RanGAP) involved in mRNA processing and transport
MFTGRTLKEIPPALGALLSAIAGHENLYHVDCSGNAIGMAASPQIVTFLKTNKSCRELILNNNGLSPEAGGLISRALSEGSLDLEVLCSQKNRWETQGIIHLGNALKGLSKLKKLDVWWWWWWCA